MFGAALICRDVRQVDIRLRSGRQLNLGLFSAFLEALHGQRIPAQVHSLVLVELVGEIIDDPAIEILAAEKCITVG